MAERRHQKEGKIARGSLIALTSQTVLLASGVLINFALARMLGLEDYGFYGHVITILLFVKILVHTGIPEAVKKFGGEDPDFMAALTAKTRYWQIIYCVAVFFLLFLAAPLVARIFRDDRLVFFLRLAGLDIIFFGMFKYVNAIQNGLHDFVNFSLVGIIYALVRLGAIVGLVRAGYSLSGAFVGNICGSTAALLLALLLVRLPKPTPLMKTPSTRKLVRFIVPNFLYFAGLNLLFFVDVWFVKYYLSGSDLGLYVSASNFSRMPYMLSIGLSAVLLPSLSRAVARKDTEMVKSVTFETVRYLLLFLILTDVFVALNARSILVFFYDTEFGAAAPVLSLIVVGLSLVTLMAVLQTVLISGNRMKTCFLQIVFLLVLDAMLNFFLVPRYGIMGAAVSTSLAGLTGAGWSIFYFRNVFGEIVFSRTFLRLAAAGVLLTLLSLAGRGLHIHILIKMVLFSGLYLAFLFAVREIKPAELRRLLPGTGD